jgi:hypothetical protein
MVFHAQENVISNIAPLSKVITIDVPFVLGETVLPGGAFFEGFYKASRDPFKSFKEKLREETLKARFAGIPESLSKVGGASPSYVSSPSYASSIGALNRLYYDSEILSVLFGYAAQASGNPNLDVGKLRDELGELLPEPFARGETLQIAGRDAGAAVHEYLTEQRILRRLSGD